MVPSSSTGGGGVGGVRGGAGRDSGGRDSGGAEEGAAGQGKGAAMAPLQLHPVGTLLRKQLKVDGTFYLCEVIEVRASA